MLALNRSPLLRADPTRTSLIRRGFEAEIKRRVRELKSAIWDFLVTQDALGLAILPPGDRVAFLGNQNRSRGRLQAITGASVRNALPREFAFRTDAGKLAAFRDWLTEQVDQKLLRPVPGFRSGTSPWTAKYIESAYKKGQINAYIAAKKEDMLLETESFVARSLERFQQAAFNAPEARSKIELLATRSFEELKGISSSMAQKMNRILAQGMVDGSGAISIAREMSKSVDGMTRQRALLIARTEVIHAHAEGQLDSFKELGVEELGIEAEWSTAGDDRVCSECQKYEGKKFSVEEAHGLIPLHPNCVLGDSAVEFLDALALTRVKYFGPVVRIRTRQGRVISVTQNHIVATARGWIRANELRKGDQLIDARSVGFPSVPTPDNNQRDVTIAEVFGLFSKTFPKNTATIARSSPENFHGDGKWIKKEIDIIWSDRRLGSELDSSFYHQLEKFHFVRGNIGTGNAETFQSFGFQAEILHSHFTSPTRSIRGQAVSCLFCGSPLAMHQTVGGGLPPGSNSGMLQSDSNGAASTTESFRDLLHALSGPITFDDIVDIKVSSPERGGVLAFDIWVYRAASYSLEGILSSNCRCTWTPATTG